MLASRNGYVHSTFSDKTNKRYNISNGCFKINREDKYNVETLKLFIPCTF